MGHEKTDPSSSKSSAEKESHFRLFSLILLGICVNCYFNSLEDGFCFDDAKAIVSNHDLRPITPVYELFLNDFWGTPMHKETSHKSYRPLCVLTFRWNYAIHELDPAGYHFLNMMFHLVLCILIMYVFQMFMSEWLSFLMAVLYMVHPVHTEAVTGVVGRAEILSAIFILVALKCYALGSGYRAETKWYYIYLTVVMVVIATLCKEQGITAIAICCSYEVLWLQKVTLWEGLELAKLMVTAPRKLPKWFVTCLGRMIFLLGTTIGLMILRIFVMGAELPHFTVFDNPPASAPTPARQLTQWYLLPINMWLLIYPFPLLCDYSMGTIPLLESFADPRNLATMNFVTTMGVLTWFALTANTKTARQVSMALAFLVFPFLPATNLFFPVGFVVAERILYTPSIGFSMIVVIGLKNLLAYKRFRKVVYTLFIITVVLHGAKTARRNIDWKSERALFMAGLHMTSQNAKIWNNVGHSFERELKPEMARPFFERASIVQPDDGGAFINLGRAYAAMNMDALAMDTFRKAELLMPPKIPGKSRRIDPKFLSIYLSMAAILRKNATRYPEALELYKKAIKMWNEYEDAYVNLGDLLVQMGMLEKAEQIFAKLLEFSPRSENGLYNMGVIAVKRNDSEEALQWFEKCLAHHPKSKLALYNIAILKEKMEGQNPESQAEALERLLQLYELQKDNPRLLAKIGMMYKQMGDFEKAEKFLREAVDMDDTLLSAMFSLGHTYRLMKEYERGLTVLEKYVKFKTDDVNAWLLLGDLYVNHRNDNDAAWKAFEEAYKLQPDSPQVNHNFCVILVRRKEYLKALECLEKLAEKSPEDFVLENLRKLEELIAKKREEGELLE
ncbi:Transmembrane and TPR repeat-containing protein 3 [Holothuria leucospilota]|uniref:dolichyl-phosphate-mannose--protein mannosyltransferase n=1 Tax=Holothuria leucospilota TaxID=206669 RepID=A0A9Q1H4K9_HOLLE|nr:Transmembrane and TPR repeat-containing protein 3 [Holothuria leucospilota]